MKTLPALLISLCCLGTTHADYVSTLTAQNPAAWYRMDDATDAVGGGPLTANSVVLGVTTASGSGTTEIPDQTTLAGLTGAWSTYAGAPGDTVTDLYLPSTAAGSVSFWASKAPGIASSTSTTLMASQGGTNFDGTDPSMLAGFVRNDGSAGFRLHDTNGAVSQLDSGAGAVTMNTWTHFAYTWDRGTGSSDGVVSLYLNGALEDQDTGLSWNAFSIDRARWGKETSGARFFGGGADEIAFWDRALTPSEVSSQHAAGFTSVIPEPQTALLLGLSLAFLVLRRGSRIGAAPPACE